MAYLGLDHLAFLRHVTNYRLLYCDQLYEWNELWLNSLWFNGPKWINLLMLYKTSVWSWTMALSKTIDSRSRTPEPMVTPGPIDTFGPNVADAWTIADGWMYTSPIMLHTKCPSSPFWDLFPWLANRSRCVCLYSSMQKNELNVSLFK